MRKNIAAGNWKMNTSIEEGLQLSREICNHTIPSKVQVILAAPYTHLKSLVDQTYHVEGLDISAQNCHEKEHGAFTGEISANMLSKMSVDYVIIGHSERRLYFGESNEILKSKVDTALKNGLEIIFCCGEPLDVRQSNAQNDFVLKQLEESLFHLEAADMEKVVVAYEPIWAIGTGETASPDQAQEMHAFIRSKLEESFNEQVAADCSILYGGSVKPANAKEIFSKPDVDGGLVGGASLQSEKFIQIIESF